MVAVLLADHLSPAQQERLATLDARFDDGPEMYLPAGSGDQAVRQFARADEPRTPGNDTPPIQIFDPPTPAAQTQRILDQPESIINEADPHINQAQPHINQAEPNINEVKSTIGEAINNAAQPQGADSPPLTPFGPAQPEEPASRPVVVMGGQVNKPDATAAPPVDHGDAEAYTVQARDTLYGLCKRFYGNGGLYVKLAKFNEGIVPDHRRIREGMTLWIPSQNVLEGRADSTTPTTSPTLTPTSKPVTKPATKPATQRPAKSVKTVNYTIRENDRLWDIAKDHLGKGGRWQEIVNLNKDIIRNPDVLPIGRTIRLPAK